MNFTWEGTFPETTHTKRLTPKKRGNDWMNNLKPQCVKIVKLQYVAYHIA